LISQKNGTYADDQYAGQRKDKALLARLTLLLAPG
jgi:hypothetical protein